MEAAETRPARAAITRGNVEIVEQGATGAIMRIWNALGR